MDVPKTWMYAYYLKIREPLDGRRIRIKSPFNSEKTPSCFIYVKDGRYQWKDFSSGKGGSSAVSLARAVLEHAAGYEIGLPEVAKMVISDYKAWQATNGKYDEMTIESEHNAYSLICDFKKAEWQMYDINYWESYGINKQLLEEYNVFPLEHFRLGKKYENRTRMFPRISLHNSYGFFNSFNHLLKIYNPCSKDFKHINIKKDLLGREQLKGHKTCIIAASMKDMLTIKAVGLNVDVVAPMSEKTFIDRQDLTSLLDMYSDTLVLFDNDKTGIIAALNYKRFFDIDFIYIPYYKDIAEMRELTADPIFVKHELTMKINAKIQ